MTIATQHTHESIRDGFVAAVRARGIEIEDDAKTVIRNGERVHIYYDSNVPWRYGKSTSLSFKAKYDQRLYTLKAKNDTFNFKRAAEVLELRLKERDEQIVEQEKTLAASNRRLLGIQAANERCGANRENGTPYICGAVGTFSINSGWKGLSLEEAEAAVRTILEMRKERESAE